MGDLGGGGGLGEVCLPLYCLPGSGGVGRGRGGRVVGEQERSPWLGCGDDHHQGICGVSIGWEGWRVVGALESASHELAVVQSRLLPVGGRGRRSGGCL